MRAMRRARLVFLGGSALEAPRYIWWNFVSSRRERIEQTKEQTLVQHAFVVAA